MHSAPSDKEENSKEGSNNEGNGTSDEEHVVTEEEPKQCEAQTTDRNSGCVNVLEESTQNNTDSITVAIGSQLLLQQH